MNSPFEQFIINPCYNLQLDIFEFGIADFSLTNVTITLGLILLITVLLLIFIKAENFDFYLFPTYLDSIIHLTYIICQYLLERHVNVRFFQQEFFPLIFSLAVFLLIMNLVGNIPGCMSLTAQIGVVCAYALPMIFGVFFFVLFERDLSFLRTFHSPGTSSTLAILLFPIEVLTFVMRPVSIICRLVANFISGHIIFKVFLGAAVEYAFSIKSISLMTTLFTSLSLSFLAILIILELAISIIQVYVFIVIFCMFLSDSFGHHFRH